MPGGYLEPAAAACATYFSRRPREVAEVPLERLLAWSARVEKAAYDTDGIRRLVVAYRTSKPS
jgi:hypothetical protein